MMMKLLGAPKQPHKDPLEEVVSVRFQMNSRAVSLWCEHDPHQLPGVRHKFELKKRPIATYAFHFQCGKVL